MTATFFQAGAVREQYASNTARISTPRRRPGLCIVGADTGAGDRHAAAVSNHEKNAASKLAPTSVELLKHLSLLFVPAGVGLMVHAQRVATVWLPIMAALVSSTVDR